MNKEEIKKAVDILCEFIEPIDESIHYDLKDKCFDGFYFSCVKQYGGEGDSAPLYTIIEIKNSDGSENAFVKFTGEYSSWDYSRWRFGNSFEIVEKRKVEVEAWVNVENGKYDL